MIMPLPMLSARPPGIFQGRDMGKALSIEQSSIADPWAGSLLKAMAMMQRNADHLVRFQVARARWLALPRSASVLPKVGRAYDMHFARTRANFL